MMRIEPYKVLHAHPTTSEERKENWLHLQQWEKKRLEVSNLLYHQQGGEGELKKANPALFHQVPFSSNRIHTQNR